MKFNPYGNTDIKVSQMGFGAGHIGSTETSQKNIEALFNQILDSGINLLGRVDS